MSPPLHLHKTVSTENGHCCPFGNARSEICSASMSSMIIAASRRQEYCDGDDYDNCPIFLARVLRRRD